LSISDPGSRIPYPKQQQKRRVKKICCPAFFVATISQNKSYFIFEQAKKKLWANLQRIKELFMQKIFINLSKIWVCDPGSEIRDPAKTYIPDPGSRDQKGFGSQIGIRNTAYSSIPVGELAKNFFPNFRSSSRTFITVPFEAGSTVRNVYNLYGIPVCLIWS
jgi:hypothetical protein